MAAILYYTDVWCERIGKQCVRDKMQRYAFNDKIANTQPI